MYILPKKKKTNMAMENLKMYFLLEIVIFHRHIYALYQYNVAFAYTISMPTKP